MKEFFVYTVKELLEIAFEEQMDFKYEDFALTLDTEPHYSLSERLVSSEDFISVWNDSDLPSVIYRFAESAIRRYKHLEKHPEKTEAKIRMYCTKLNTLKVCRNDANQF
ncbi:hypothetical protein KA005_18535 [bacterium]|nr:hypothetical protein [bacterium]